jgi:hypothetical protein
MDVKSFITLAPEHTRVEQQFAPDCGHALEALLADTRLGRGQTL